MDAPDADLPMTLAELKARQVAADHPEALVLGADGILTCDGKRFDKPADAAAAAAHLRAFSGRTHSLVTAAVIMHQGQRIWHVVERAHLTMRPLTAAYIEGYGGRVTGHAETVGAYRLEGRGMQLFEKSMVIISLFSACRCCRCWPFYGSVIWLVKDGVRRRGIERWNALG